MDTAQDALIEGQHAGRLGLASGLNPYQIGTHQYHEWERGRSSQIAQALARVIRPQARTSPCRYKADLECNCGGRGLCLDVA